MPIRHQHNFIPGRNVGDIKYILVTLNACNCQSTLIAFQALQQATKSLPYRDLLKLIDLTLDIILRFIRDQEIVLYFLFLLQNPTSTINSPG